MSTKPDRALVILMVAGEPSGDAHGAELIQSMKERNPKVRVIGVGGPKMAAAGQEQLIDISKDAVLGLVEVLKKYWKFRGFRDQILALARRERPDAVVLIDFSGFNLRISPALRRVERAPAPPAPRPATALRSIVRPPAGRSPVSTLGSTGSSRTRAS